MAYTVWNNGSILVFIAKLSAKKSDSDLKKRKPGVEREKNIPANG